MSADQVVVAHCAVGVAVAELSVDLSQSVRARSPSPGLTNRRRNAEDVGDTLLDSPLEVGETVVIAVPSVNAGIEG